MKKLFAVFFSLTFALCVFAETTQTKPILSENDVSSFVKNFDKIRTELAKLDCGVEDPRNLITLNVTLEKIQQIQNILNKYGITDKGFEKMKAIAYAYALELYNLTLEADPETAQMIKSLNMDPMAEIRKLVAPSDCEIVKKYFDKLEAVFFYN